MVVAIETVGLCLFFFILCFLGTGTDDKNLKSFSSYPDEVQTLIRNNEDYRAKVKTTNKCVAFLLNFLIFLVILFILGIAIRKPNFLHNFICLSIIGQGLNLFDLLVIDLIWWRRTKRIRFTKIPEKDLYQNPRKHIESFLRAFVMYLLIAAIDGYLLQFL
nr:ABC transporter permease [Streptococcus lutetiensis]